MKEEERKCCFESTNRVAITKEQRKVFRTHADAQRKVNEITIRILIYSCVCWLVRNPMIRKKVIINACGILQTIENSILFERRGELLNFPGVLTRTINSIWDTRVGEER